tara:strand:+ start:897 stop:2390 length:1494 start_codon:yes stop_codon:yes gene_type:complete
MKPSLQLRISQQLTMTPQLQQAIRLLQLSTLDLQQEIQENLEANPMLEAVDEYLHNDIDPQDLNSQKAADPKDAISTETNQADYENPAAEAQLSEDWNAPSASVASGNSNSGDYDSMEFESPGHASDSLSDHLQWQLNLTPMSDLDRLIAEPLIDGIDPDGYLRVSIEDVLECLGLDALDLSDDERPEAEEVEAVLRRIQHFDPPGVGARDLRECLLIQLDQLPRNTEPKQRYTQARQLVNQHLALLGSRDFKQLLRRMKLKENELLEVIEIIQSLNPRPGSLIDYGDAEYVIPDVTVKKEQGSWTVNLNNGTMPKIRINSDYADLVKRADNSADNVYLKNHLQEARWFIKSLQSRNETLLKVSCKIVEHQQDFLEYGEEAMKPLVLAEIAEAVEMHESTISRVTTQKFMHTPRGIFELKYFFSSHVSTVSGGECSSIAIRAIIKKLVAAEIPTKPLSDSKIAALLEEQGVQVARRTIAKYREALQIPPSNERKRLV